MKVFYRKEQSVPRGVLKSFSPSMSKPELVVAQWLERYPDKFVVASDFPPATREDFYRVHAPKMVDGVLDLRQKNGFGNVSPEIAASLPYTTGSLLAAAGYVFKHGGFACSPTSGFHHAGYEYNAGFCTFNGLMVTATALLLAGAAKVGIIDCDQHYGDGTEDILKRFGLEGRVLHFTLGWLPATSEKEVLEDLEYSAKRIAEEVDMIIYQAGADSHIDDPLGGVFTTEGYRKRDQIVFSAALAAGTPLVWNLAGGYQTPIQKVLDLHNITFELACEADNNATRDLSYDRKRSFKQAG